MYLPAERFIECTAIRRCHECRALYAFFSGKHFQPFHDRPAEPLAAMVLMGTYPVINSQFPGKCDPSRGCDLPAPVKDIDDGYAVIHLMVIYIAIRQRGGFALHGAGKQHHECGRLDMPTRRQIRLDKLRRRTDLQKDRRLGNGLGMLTDPIGIF